MNNAYKAVLLFGVVLMIGCKLTTTSVFEPIKRVEVSPLIEQRVRQYVDSSRVISIHGGEFEDVYVIAVRKGASKAKDLVTKK